MRGVQAQRLVRKACTSCARPVDPPALFGEQLEGIPPRLLGDRWIRVEGCESCRRTGYRGRTGIYELVPVTADLQDLVVGGAKLDDLRTLARRQGHRTLLQDGFIKASHGHTTVEEITRLALEG